MAVLQNNHAVVSSLFVSKTEGCIKAFKKPVALYNQIQTISQNEKKKKKRK